MKPIDGCTITRFVGTRASLGPSRGCVSTGIQVSGAALVQLLGPLAFSSLTVSGKLFLGLIRRFWPWIPLLIHFRAHLQSLIGY